MRIDWDFDDQDIATVRLITTKQADNPFVRKRVSRNLATERPMIDRSEFWWTLVACLLTSQQRSGPNQPVALLIRENPFPLNLDICNQQTNLRASAEKVLRGRRGIRFTQKIPEYLVANLNHLNRNYWTTVEHHLRELSNTDSRDGERVVCRDFIENFKGIGPKQARNLLQGLGLTKYEIPLDSRINRWLKNAGFPIPLSSTVLNDEDYYAFALDGVQELCRLAEVYPCVFDASVFSSVDGAEWTEENAIY